MASGLPDTNLAGSYAQTAQFKRAACVTGVSAAAADSSARLGTLRRDPMALSGQVLSRLWRPQRTLT